MSGHSHWSTIKHQKGAADAKRGQLFTKLTREIIVSVREGGSNPEGNSRLRLAIQKARDSAMPYENIDRAIKRGEGSLEGMTLTEVTLEGYGPGGSAILVQALSDNRNRTVQDVRNLFTRHNGSLAESGSVTWLFENKGVIRVHMDGLNADDISLKAIDAGADDVDVGEEHVEIYTKPGDLESVRTALEKSSVPVESAEVIKAAKQTIQIDEKSAIQTLKLIHRLEDLDEVQNVFTNVDFSDDVLEKYEAEQA